METFLITLAVMLAICVLCGYAAYIPQNKEDSKKLPFKMFGKKL